VQNNHVTNENKEDNSTDQAFPLEFSGNKTTSRKYYSYLKN